MKRAGIIVIGVIVLLYAAIMAGAAPMPIKDSKHNLSAPGYPDSGPGPIQSVSPASGGTTEICVFCHTPHSATTEAPLWNRSLPVASYTTYTSDVMAGLGYTLENPQDTGAAGKKAHLKTRICMSCHDGTIAMGVLVNYPTGISSEIPMSGTTGGKMPLSSAGYIGTDLRDSHPVAVKHNPGTTSGEDPELKTLGAGDRVRLYNGATGAASKNDGTNNGDYVECTSCHDAHDNQYGKFMIDAYVGSDSMGSNICRQCHNKAGDDSSVANESAHSNTTYNTSYTPTTLGGTVEKVKCFVCHYPHKAGIASYGGSQNAVAGKYLLTYEEEKTCFNNTNRWGQATNVCHGSAATTTKRLDDQVSKSSAHKVGNYSAATAKQHNATEGRTVSASGTGWLGVAGNTWHVECDDCHNSHAAGKLTHTAPGNGVTSTSSIYGAGGAEPPGSYTAWTVPAASAYTYIEPIGALRISGTNLGVTKEYQICLKCHSSFAWGTSGPSSVPTAGLTDQAKEFNTANTSFHPVFAQRGNGNGTLSSPWTSTSTMYCSDCHGNDSSGPVGPHGSGISAILKYTALSTYSSVTNGSADEGAAATSLCLQCHPASVYNTYQTGDAASGTGFMDTNATPYNLHNRHKTLARTSGSSYAYRCVNCHVKIPHGWNARKAFVIANGDPEAGVYAPAGGPLLLTAPLAGAGSYATGDANKNVNCTTAAGCH